jgi:hypothetical protein
MRARDALIVFVYTIGSFIFGPELFEDDLPKWYIYLNVAIMVVFI